MLEDDEGNKEQCDYRFRFKECDECGAQNDIAARKCHDCGAVMADPDDKLRNALNLKDALVLRCSGLSVTQLKNEMIKVTYFDEDGASCDEVYDIANKGAAYIFNRQFGKRVGQGQAPVKFKTAEQVINAQLDLIAPDFVICA